MTVGELFDYMTEDSTRDNLLKNSVDISLMHLKESMEAINTLQKNIEEKYRYLEDEAEVSESDIDDLNITAQALMNSLCMYMGAIGLNDGADESAMDKHLSKLDEMLGR